MTSQVRDLDGLRSAPATWSAIRDKTLLMILAYTAARAGAVARLRTMDYFTDGRAWFFHFGEKGGKLHQVPVRHDLQLQMGALPPGRGPRGAVQQVTPVPDGQEEKEAAGADRSGPERQ